MITTVDEFGNQWGMTATSVTSVSVEPPLLLVCINRGSGLAGPMTASAGFVVHLLAGEQDELARCFASPLEDKFAGVSHEYTTSGCARITGAMAVLECDGYAAYPGGDHTIVVGRVVAVTVAEQADSALVFLDGRMIPVPGAT